MKPKNTPQNNKNTKWLINYCQPDQFRYIESGDGLIEIHDKLKARYAANSRQKFREYLKANSAKQENDSTYLVIERSTAEHFCKLALNMFSIITRDVSTRISKLKRKKKKSARDKETIERLEKEVKWLRNHRAELQPRVYVREVKANPDMVVGVFGEVRE